MTSSVAFVRQLDANPPHITTGGQSRTNNPYGVSYSNPLVSRPVNSYDQLESDAWVATSNALIEPVTIETTFYLAVLSANNFLIQTILPVQVIDKPQKTWTKFIFKPYLPNKMPYFSVARFVKGSREEREAAFVRVGLGFTLEQNFMATPLGAQFYIYHMKQISQSFIEQLQHDALYALLNSDMWALDAIGKRRDVNGKVFVDQMATVMEREVLLFNYMQKTSNAWVQLNRWVDSRSNLYTNEKLNTWILDQRIDGFRTNVPTDQTDFYIFGPGNQSNLQDGIQYFHRDTLGNTIYCTRGYRIDERPEFNPLENIVQTGEYYMNVDQRDTDYSKYDSNVRSMQIYNEGLDCMSTLTLNDMIENCQRFNARGDLITTNQFRLNAGQDFSDLQHDFLYRKNNAGEIVPKLLFGQLERAHCNDIDKRNLGESVCHALKMNMTSDQIGTMLNDLQRCVNVIATLNASDISDWLADLNASTISAESFELNTGAGGVPVIATQNWPLPPTHASYRGFKEIQRQADIPALAELLRRAFSPQYIDIIQKNMPLFDRYIETLDGMFPGCALLTPSLGAANIANATLKDAAFENLLKRQVPFVTIVPRGLTDAAIAAFDQDTNRQVNNFLPADGITGRPFYGISDDASVDTLARRYVINTLYRAVGGNAYDATFARLNGEINRTSPANFDNRALLSLINIALPINTDPDRNQVIQSLTSEAEYSVSSGTAQALLARGGFAATNAVDFARIESTYADRYNGASTKIENLALSRNVNTGLVTSSSAPTPTPVVATAPVSNFRSQRSVGFSGTFTAPSVPTGTSAQFLPTMAISTPGQSELQEALNTPQMRGHYTEACQRFANEPQYLVPVLLFLFTKITKFSVRASSDHNFWHPFNYIVARPHMLYDAVSGIKTIPGSGTGNTYISQMAANVANDNQTNETMVHVTAWTGAAVTAQTPRVFVAPNILVVKYHKGNGVGWINPVDYAPSQGVFGSDNDASLMAFAQPRNEKYGKCFSLSGELSMTDVMGQTVPIRTNTDEKLWSYSSAGFYNRIYGFNLWNWKTPVRGLKPREIFVPNRVVYASLALYRNQITHAYDRATVNTGHWPSELVGPNKAAQRVGDKALTDFCALTTSTSVTLSCF